VKAVTKILRFAFAIALLTGSTIVVAENVATLQAESSNLTKKTNTFRHDQYSGFYPLIEDTGYTQKQGSWRVGFNEIGYTLFHKYTVSTAPMLYTANTPNLKIKGKVYEDKRHALAVSASVNMLLPGTDDFFSAFYSSRIFNPNSTLYVVPISISHSLRLNRFVTLHHSVTDINVYASTDFKTKANLAYGAMLQLKARSNHSLNLHGSEVGFWDHDYYLFGVSYRYSGKYFFTQMGYFNRVQLEGVQGIPLFDIGFLL
jgi:hypothetical protein